MRRTCGYYWPALGADAVTDMPAIGVALKLADAHEGVVFPPRTDGQG